MFYSLSGKLVGAGIAEDENRNAASGCEQRFEIGEPAGLRAVEIKDDGLKGAFLKVGNAGNILTLRTLKRSSPGSVQTPIRRDQLGVSRVAAYEQNAGTFGKLHRTPDRATAVAHET